MTRDELIREVTRLARGRVAVFVAGKKLDSAVRG